MMDRVCDSIHDLAAHGEAAVWIRFPNNWLSKSLAVRGTGTQRKGHEIENEIRGWHLAPPKDHSRSSVPRSR